MYAIIDEAVWQGPSFLLTKGWQAHGTKQSLSERQ